MNYNSLTVVKLQRHHSNRIGAEFTYTCENLSRKATNYDSYQGFSQENIVNLTVLN